MKDPKIEIIRIDDLIPYDNNPRQNDAAIEYVARSISEFGFKVPIVIDRQNVIVTGHTRLKAAKRLGLKNVPCIRADDLTEDQCRAFRLADNKVGEFSSWDPEKLVFEIGEISMDLETFGFDFSGFGEEPGEFKDLEEYEGYYGDERERTNNAYNLGLVDHENLTPDFWQMPVIKSSGYIPKDLIGFNYAKTSEKKDVGIHFYIDDYQFERIWNDPEKYLDVLIEYDCILSPDFSLYMQMPMPMKIWNVYRSRQIGAFYQSKGLRVIPTVSWAEPATFSFCFQGIPKGSVVSISTIGVKRDPASVRIWKDGVDEMIRKIEPSAILIYGGKLEHDFGKIKTVYYDNHVTNNWGKGEKKNDD